MVRFSFNESSNLKAYVLVFEGVLPMKNLSRAIFISVDD